MRMNFDFQGGVSVKTHGGGGWARGEVSLADNVSNLESSKSSCDIFEPHFNQVG